MPSPADLSVPTADSSANSSIRDVIGNKSDTHDGDSVYAKLETLGDHVHHQSRVYPTLANGVTVTGGAAWTLGAFAEIVPASTITSDFDIHHVSIEAISANDVYELVLYAVEVEIGRVRFTKNAAQDGVMNVPIQTPIQSANAQIQAKVASSSGADTVDISLFYHTY